MSGMFGPLTQDDNGDWVRLGFVWRVRIQENAGSIAVLADNLGSQHPRTIEVFLYPKNYDAYAAHNMSCEESDAYLAEARKQAMKDAEACRDAYAARVNGVTCPIQSAPPMLHSETPTNALVAIGWTFPGDGSQWSWTWNRSQKRVVGIGRFRDGQLVPTDRSTIPEAVFTAIAAACEGIENDPGAPLPTVMFYADPRVLSGRVG